MKKVGKKSLIGGILALSLILGGTGYAYWTDTLNITTKATTGEFGMKFVDLGLYAQYSDEINTDGAKGWSIVDGIDKGYVESDFFERGTQYNKIAKDGSIEKYKERQKGYSNTEFDAKLKDAAPLKKQVGPYNSANTNGSDRIDIKINEMYPGYAQAFRSDLLNVGSIAAKLGNMKFTVSSKDKDASTVKDMLGIALYMHQEQFNPKSSINNAHVFRLTKDLALSDKDFFTVGGVDFLRLSALEKLDEKDIKKAIENSTILCSPATDNRMDVFIGIAMDPDKDGAYTTGSTENLKKDNDDTKSQNKGVEIGIDFLWDQFNVGKDEGKPNILKNQNYGGQKDQKKDQKDQKDSGSVKGN